MKTEVQYLKEIIKEKPNNPLNKWYEKRIYEMENKINFSTSKRNLITKTRT